MPTVRRPIEQVERAPLPGQRFAPEVTEEGLGVGRGGAARDAAVLQMAQDAERRSGSLAVARADRVLAEKAEAIEQRARSARGLDAAAAAEDALRAFDDAYADVEKNLVGGEQITAVSQAAGRRRLSLDSSLQVHVAGERERFDAETTKALLEADAITIRRNYLDGGTVDRTIDHAKDVFEAHGHRIGLPEEAIDLELAKIESGARADVIRGFVANSQPKQARAYFELYRDAILPNEAERIQEILKSATRTADAESASSEIASGLIESVMMEDPEIQIEDPETGVVRSAGVTRAVRIPTVWEAEEKIRTYPEEIREDIRTLVRRRLADFAASEDAGRKARMKAGYEAILLTGRYDAIDPLTEAAYDESEKATLREFADKVTAPGKVVTDEELMYHRRLEAAFDPAAFIKRDLYRDAGRIAPEDLRKLEAIQAGLIKDDAKVKEELRKFGYNDRIITAAVDRIPELDEDRRRQILADIRYQVMGYIQFQQGRGAEKVTDPEIRKFVDGLLMRRSPQNGNERWEFMTPKERADSIRSREDVPPAVIRKLNDQVRLLRAMGAPVTVNPGAPTVEIPQVTFGPPYYLGTTRYKGTDPAVSAWKKAQLGASDEEILAAYTGLPVETVRKYLGTR